MDICVAFGMGNTSINYAGTLELKSLQLCQAFMSTLNVTQLHSFAVKERGLAGSLESVFRGHKGFHQNGYTAH